MADVKAKILKALSHVKDPEIGLPITELGLVYDVKTEGKKAYITMTLTTLGCPLFDVIEAEVKERMKKVKEIEWVRLALTFDPPWSPERMSKKAKAQLGFL
jgi:metal-sulfur cluster biosynthetic enzyme